ncbi:TonB-dependent receptor [Kordiimonas sp.]|uniref:TonB-dependent receptor n=1 Tax=Kordiimonas sp. TaxID=1970157 RepID=UPI003A8FCA3A
MSEPILKTLVVLSLPLMCMSGASAQALKAPLSQNSETNDSADGWQEIAVVERRLPVFVSGQRRVTFVPGDHAGLRLDSQLAAQPGLSLFRRANSLTAHPTTQGLAMRGIGANAAGRVLVTLDGVPMGDPFGGWVFWSSFAAGDLAEVAVLPGGSAGAFGAQALSGVVDIRSRSAADTRPAFEGWFGANDSFSLSGRAGFALGGADAAISAGHFQTDGDYLVSADARGPVDVPAASEASHAALTLEHDFGAVSARGTLRYFREARTNGLALAINSTEAVDASLTLAGVAGEGQWEVVSYYRARAFENVFSSARDARTTELAVLDQYDVPAWGAGMLARLKVGGFEVGIDGRRTSGETNERFRNLGDGFTRDRTAGGDQWTLGAYGELSHTDDWGSMSATLRLDRWRSYSGARVERDITSSDVLRDDEVPARGGWQPSARLGALVALTGAIDMRAAAYRSWRLPTLNEYYRPFRVVNDITEANPDLVPEKLYGMELGFDYEPLNTFKLSATVFRNWLKDGVGNVTIGFGPGFFPLGGFVPDGGVLRQRANIGESITDGVELSGKLLLQPGVTLRADYLFARARITRFDAMPELIGKRPVQTPRHALTLALAYDTGGPFTLQGDMRFTSSQYDDDQNLRRLGSIATANMSAAYQVNETVSLTAAAENIFGARVVSAVTADGFETLAQRRFWRLGVRVGF